MAYINKEELRQLINQLKNDTDDVAILVGINRVGSGIEKLPTADVISAEAYNQVAWERDMAMQQIESYGVSFGSNAELVEVVRCKVCTKHEKGCPLDTHPYMTPNDGYCYKGKRSDT